MRRVPFAPGEWYNCYSRGIDKRKTFESKRDYERFSELLYLANSNIHVKRSDLGHRTHEDIFFKERGSPYVTIGAWCLMPNHFHLLLKEKEEEGVSTFMMKLMNAYTKYFNIKNERNGNLFAVPFRAKHVLNDRYAQRAVAYIHLNPASLAEPKWKEYNVIPKKKIISFIDQYPYSSLFDYREETSRSEKLILDSEGFDLFQNQNGKVSDLVDEAVDYREEIGNPWG